MEDIFIEQLVKRKKGGVYYLKVIMTLLAAILIVFALVTLFLSFPIIGVITPILFAGCVYGTYWLLSSMNLEYEYVMTNGEIDIDCITNRRRRKRVFAGRAKDFEIMARLDSDEYADVRRTAIGQGATKDKVLDFSAVPGNPSNWFFIANYKSERVMVFFSPNEKILTSLRKYNPSKILYRPTRAR